MLKSCYFVPKALSSGSKIVIPSVSGEGECGEELECEAAVSLDLQR